MCHGKTGDADGPAVIELNIHPAKLSDPQLNTESDGALFWKITTGKKPMPAYGKRLSDTDRWNLVNYIQNLEALSPVANEVNLERSADSVEHAPGKPTAARSQKVTTLLLFKSSRAAPGDEYMYEKNNHQTL